MPILTKRRLENEYLKKRKSVAQIARCFHCSQHKVNYWLSKYSVQKRRISEALYLKHNPHGDPFSFKKPKAIDEVFLWGLGLGLFWGEGNKKNTHSVRLGNTDSALIRMFIRFLDQLYIIDHRKLKF